MSYCLSRPDSLCTSCPHSPLHNGPFCAGVGYYLDASESQKSARAAHQLQKKQEASAKRQQRQQQGKQQQEQQGDADSEDERNMQPVQVCVETFVS